MHEDSDYYKKCHYRIRNRGLFTADQVFFHLSRFVTIYVNNLHFFYVELKEIFCSINSTKPWRYETWL